MMPSRLSAADLTVFRHCRWSSVSGVSRTSSVMPRMAFMGVRISWLTLARNSSLARLAASAASLARRNSSSSRLRSGDILDDRDGSRRAGRPRRAGARSDSATQTSEPSLRR